MRLFHDVPEVYLHKAPVDFRKSINGLVALVQAAGEFITDDDARLIPRQGEDVPEESVATLDPLH